jgi:hypothetical protein
MHRRARAYETQAAAAGDIRGALLALREERGTLELLATMTGELEGPHEPVQTLLYAFDPDVVFPDPPPIPGHAKGTAATP